MLAKVTHRVKMDCVLSLRIFADMELRRKQMFDQQVLKVKSQIFNGFYRYMSYTKHFRQKHTVLSLMTERNMRQRYFDNLKFWRAKSKYFRVCSQTVHKKHVGLHFKAWHDLYAESHDLRKENRMARKRRVKHLFRAMKAGIKVCAHKNRIKGGMEVK